MQCKTISLLLCVTVTLVEFLVLSKTVPAKWWIIFRCLPQKYPLILQLLTHCIAGKITWLIIKNSRNNRELWNKYLNSRLIPLAVKLHKVNLELAEYDFYNKFRTRSSSDVAELQHMTWQLHYKLLNCCFWRLVFFSQT